MTDQPAAAAPMAKPKKYFRPRKYSSRRMARPVDPETYGPCMLALTEKQRRLVEELRWGPSGYGGIVRAARAAGYGTPNSTDNSIKAIASRAVYSKPVQAALKELGGKIIRAEAFQSIAALADIAGNPNHKDQRKAIADLMNRGGFPAENNFNVVHDKPSAVIVVATEEVLARIEQLAARAGLDHAKLPPMIDVTPTEVEHAAD